MWLTKHKEGYVANVLHESAEDEGTGSVHHSVTDEDKAHVGHAQGAGHVRLKPHDVTEWTWLKSHGITDDDSWNYRA